MNHPPSSMTVSADAQFTVDTIFRPFKGFEATYQGQDATIPIVFPGDLDPEAGKVAGISPYLLRGIPVPLGAKVTLWFPMVTADFGEGATDGYVYLLHWRLRSVADMQRAVVAGRTSTYHLKKAGFGAPDTLLAPSSPNRLVIPSATETVIYQQSEPVAVSPNPAKAGSGLGNLRSELIAVPDDGVSQLPTAGLPFLPPNSAPAFANAFPSGSTTPLGAFQQGVLDPTASVVAPYSIFRPYFTVAKGDELLISVVRDPLTTTPSPNVWDFTGIDAEFSNFYGTNTASPTHAPFEDLGVYMFTGTNPS